LIYNLSNSLNISKYDRDHRTESFKDQWDQVSERVRSQ